MSTQARTQNTTSGYADNRRQVNKLSEQTRTQPNWPPSPHSVKCPCATTEQVLRHPSAYSSTVDRLPTSFFLLKDYSSLKCVDISKKSKQTEFRKHRVTSEPTALGLR